MTLTAPLYMLRHGETAWNTERRMQGTKDFAADRARPRPGAGDGPHARRPSWRARRARRSSCAARSAACARPREIIGRELGLDPAEWRDDPRLAELSYGQWEGFSWKEIEVTHPTALGDWRADPHGYCPPGGETHFDLRRRSAAVLAEIVASGTRTVVVGHGVSGAVLRGLNLGLDAKAMFVLEKPQDAFFRLLAGVEERIACSARRSTASSRSRAVRRQPPVSVTTSAPPSLFAVSLPSRRSVRLHRGDADQRERRRWLGHAVDLPQAGRRRRRRRLREVGHRARARWCRRPSRRRSRSRW